MLDSRLRHSFIVTKTKTIHTNGASVYFNHLSHTLTKHFNQSSKLICKNDFIPTGEDFTWFQSEWYDELEVRLEEIRKKGGKTICLIGHFVKGEHNFPDPNKIEADYFISMWKGEAIESIDKDIIYFPHAYCTCCELDDSPTKFDGADILWTGNTHSMRDEALLRGLDMTQVYGVNPEQLDSLYKKARISLNLHGECQKGVISNEYTTQKAYALNERFFHIIGAGGYQVCDDHPLIKETLNSDVITYRDEDELLDMLDPMNYKKGFYKDAKKEVLRYHTYVKRLDDLFTKHIKW